MLVLIGSSGFLITVSESEALLTPIVKDPTPSEIKLAEDGYYAHEYSVLPFGDKHFFSKTDNPLSLAEIATGRCMMSATYLVKEGVVNVSMKFPNDLIWPGMHAHSTFFKTSGGYHTYTDESGNAVTKNTKVIWEKLNPIIDSEFITVEFSLRNEIGSLIVNSTTLPDWSNKNSNNKIADSCPLIIPKMEYDYYDRVYPMDLQKTLAEIRGFPPDTFICQNNLIGAIKETNDKSVCIKPDSKIKLIERGWAKDFSDYEN